VTESAPATDLLCIAAHTDDAEIGIGATLSLLSRRGRSVRVCDLTRGEMATNATPDQRWREAEAASQVLGLTGRVQLALPDGFLSPDDAQQVAPVVAVLRRLRPRWVVVAPDPTRHPDHLVAPRLVQRACFLARLVGFVAAGGEERWWPQIPDLTPAATWIPEALFEVCPDNADPTLVFDVGTTWEVKLRALACFASQFSREDHRRPTYINSAEFQARIETRGRAWGARAGVEYGEALRSRALPVLDDLPRERWA
jgi:bacillithiol biosynthesis deacetylase BshB1